MLVVGVEAMTTAMVVETEMLLVGQLGRRRRSFLMENVSSSFSEVFVPFCTRTIQKISHVRICFYCLSIGFDIYIYIRTREKKGLSLYYHCSHVIFLGNG